MHPNPVFHTATDAENLAFARARGFGTLSVNGADHPLLAHVPFLLSEGGDTIDLHLVRSNPITRAAKDALPAILAVTGPDSYVSPDWYGIEDQVPTWNYIAVHLSGLLERRPQEELRALLDRESDFFEGRLLPKPVWKTAKTDPVALDKMMRMIVPFRMRISAVDGTWKLSQNKPDAARRKAAGEMESHGVGLEPAALAARMRDA